jgi:two-component system nitrogen regulation response regulator GlnG
VGSVLIPAFLPDGFGAESGAAEQTGAAVPGGFQFEPFLRARLEAGADDLYTEAHRQLDRILLPLALEFTGGNQRLAARMLGIARQTLGVKLREAGLSLKRSVEDEKDDKE